MHKKFTFPDLSSHKSSLTHNKMIDFNSEDHQIKEKALNLLCEHLEKEHTKSSSNLQSQNIQEKSLNDYLSDRTDFNHNDSNEQVTLLKTKLEVDLEHVKKIAYEEGYKKHASEYNLLLDNKEKEDEFLASLSEQISKLQLEHTSIKKEFGTLATKLIVNILEKIKLEAKIPFEKILENMLKSIELQVGNKIGQLILEVPSSQVSKVQEILKSYNAENFNIADDIKVIASDQKLGEQHCIIRHKNTKFVYSNDQIIDEAKKMVSLLLE